MTIVSDSICRRVKLPHVINQAVRGLRVGTAYRFIYQETRIKVFPYDVIILHVGTLDLEQLSVQEFSKQYLSLVRVIAHKKPQSVLGLSAILPRAVDIRSGEKGKELDCK